MSWPQAEHDSTDPTTPPPPDATARVDSHVRDSSPSPHEIASLLVLRGCSSSSPPPAFCAPLGRPEALRRAVAQTTPPPPRRQSSVDNTQAARAGSHQWLRSPLIPNHHHHQPGGPIPVSRPATTTTTTSNDIPCCSRGALPLREVDRRLHDDMLSSRQSPPPGIARCFPLYYDTPAGRRRTMWYRSRLPAADGAATTTTKCMTSSSRDTLLDKQEKDCSGGFWEVMGGGLADFEAYDDEEWMG